MIMMIIFLIGLAKFRAIIKLKEEPTLLLLLPGHSRSMADIKSN